MSAAGLARPADAAPGLRRPDGTPLPLEGRPLATGGEARIFAVAGAPSRVAKVLHRPTEGHAAKVAWMIAHPPRGVSVPDGVHVAWPREALFDAEGRFAGFVMARARGLRLFELFNPATRLARAPEADCAVLHRAGRNLAAAFRALHAHGCVLGDVNESNVLVDAAGRVTLVDADSFQVADVESGAVHRSRVGKPEYTPPELQGCTFAEVDRAPEHDRFGLAVLLFQLLMEGTHPFAGRYPRGVEAPPVGRRIAAGHFPYAGEANPPSRPPRLAPPFGMLHPRLQALFRRAFVDGHGDAAARPAAGEWEEALAEAEAALVPCDDEPRHRFGTHLSACPWCERVRRLGVRDPWGGSAAVTSAPRAPAPADGSASTGRPLSVLPAGAPLPQRLARTLGLRGPANGWMVGAPLCAFWALSGGAPLAIAALFCTWRGWDAATRQPSAEQGPLRASVLTTMLLLALSLLVAGGPDRVAPVDGGHPPSVVIEPPVVENPLGATLLTPGEVLDAAWSGRPAAVEERGATVEARGFFVVSRSGEVEDGPYVNWSVEGGGPLGPDEADAVREAAERVALAMRFPRPAHDRTVGYVVRWLPDRVELEMLDAGVTFTRPASVAPEPPLEVSAGEEAPPVLSADEALAAAVLHSRDLSPERGDPFEATADVRIGAAGRPQPETLALQDVAWTSLPLASRRRERVDLAMRSVAAGLRFPADADGRRVRFTARWHPDRVEVLLPSSGARFARPVGERAELGGTGITGVVVDDPGDEIYDVASVDRRPRLADPARMRAAMQRNAPRFLREGGGSVRMRARFVVDRAGGVVPSSIEISGTELDLGRGSEMEAGDLEEMREQAERAARRTLRESRFVPARVEGRPVRVYVTLPVEWRG